MKNLTLIIPAKREKESLSKVLDELEPYNFDIVIVLEKEDIETIESTVIRIAKSYIKKTKLWRCNHSRNKSYRK